VELAKEGLQMTIRSVLVVVVSMLVLGAAFAKESDYEYTIPRTLDPPTIDGKLDGDIWSVFDPIQVKIRLDNGEVIEDELIADAWATYDDRNFYMAVLNRETNPKNIVTNVKQHDGDKIWRDDANELFMETANLGQQRFYKLIINAANVVMDYEYGGAANGWEPDLKSATSIGDDNWALEVQVPFSELGVQKVPVVWGWNVVRDILTSGDRVITSWSLTTTDDVNQASTFGNLLFGESIVQLSAVQPSGKLTTTWAAIKSY
jgi:hypothetical protein